MRSLPTYLSESSLPKSVVSPPFDGTHHIIVIAHRMDRQKLALVANASSAGADPTLSLHFGPLTYPGCSAIDTDTLDCADIVVEGDPTATQRVYVLASGIEVINAVEFGITYPPSVTPRYWLASGDGVTEIAESGWPATGNGIALAWGNGLASDGRTADATGRDISTRSLPRY